MTGFSKLVVYKNGVLLDANVTSSPYTDPSILSPNTSYLYKFIAYDSDGVPGTAVYKTIYTLPAITSLSVTSYTTSQIVLAYDGSYANVDISRNGTSVATNTTGTTFTDTGLIGNTSYTYIVTPVGTPIGTADGALGPSSTITKITLPNISSLSVSSATTTQIVLAYSGSYTNVSITRDGSAIATNITGTSYTDASGLSANTSYTYVVTPYNSEGVVGSTSTITKKTLPVLTTLSVSSETAAQIVLAYSGNYTSVSITRGSSAGVSSITETTTLVGITPRSDVIQLYDVSNNIIVSFANASINTTYKLVSSNNAISTSIGYYLSQNSPDWYGLWVGAYDSSTNATGYTRSGHTTINGSDYVLWPYSFILTAGISLNLYLYGTNLGNITPYNPTTQYVLINISTPNGYIATNVIGTSYTDSSGLSANTSYTYVVTPNNSSGAGSTLSVTQKTLPNITSLSSPTVTTTSIVLVYAGNYTNVSITRNGTAISAATNITGTTYTDTGLTAHSSYTYVVTPNNSAGSGVSSSITKGTLPILTALSVSSETTTQIVLVYDGSYTNVSITRNGSAIATNVTGITYTDSSGLTGGTSYTYVVTPNNSSGSGSTLSITKSTLPNITSLSLLSETTAQIVLSYSGNYTNVSITRDGSAVATNITGSSYTDVGLLPNTSHIYIVTPYNSDNNAGATSSITNVTLPNMTSISVSSETTSQIVLGYTGNYTNVSITRNGTAIATNVTGTSYTDSSGLTANTSYIYIVTPNNSAGTAGTASSITHSTLGLLSSVSVSSETTTQIVLAYTGSYTNVSITRDGSAIATHITGTSYTDSSGLTVNTSHVYIITPYNSNGDAGATSTITQSTSPNIISFGIFSETATQIVLTFSGNYTNVSITRDGSSIATGVTTSTYTDSSGISANTSYTYIVTPYNASGNAGTASSAITQKTLPNMTSLSVTSFTASQIVLAYTGNYTNVSITRNGSAIATNIIGTSYTDSSGISANTSYVYIVTPNNSVGAGTTSTITQKTLPNMTSLSVSSFTASQIVLGYTGNYTNVSITRDGSAIATNITGTSYTDSSGISANTSYVYIVTPNNSAGSGTTSTITQKTLPTMTSLSVSSQTTSQIVLAYTGNYTNVSITRDGTAIATNVTGTTYTDSSGLTANTSHIYIVTPNNSAGSGTTITSTFYTLPSLSSTVTLGTVDSNSIQMTFLSGLYSYVIVTRTDGGLTSGHITGTTYTDSSGLIASTLYSYTIVPYTVTDVAGTSVSFSATTSNGVATLSTLTVSSETNTQIVLAYTGNYTSVSITRGGTSIATGVTTATYTDTGLTANTSYTYIVTPYNAFGIGTTSTITIVTLTTIASLSLSSETTTQIVLAYSGTYTNVSITRNGTAIATNITGTSYTDTGLTANTSYTYIVTPNNSSGSAGTTATITKSTLPNLTSLTVSSETNTQIVLAYTGNYTNVSITRNGTSIATGVTTAIYTDTGLTANTSYTYIVTPYNSDGTVGSTLTTTKVTLSTVTSLSVSSYTDAQIILAYSGTYTNVSISRDGSAIATNIIGTTYTDISGLTANTSYTYILTPYDASGDAGTTSTITQKTLTDITSLSVSSETATQIVLAYTGTYTTVSISRGGSTIATGVTTATYTDASGLTANTSYTYIVTPYDSSGNAGLTSTITKITLPNITSFSVSSQTDIQIVLAYTGNYTNVSITRDGSGIATNITGTTYTDVLLLSPNTSYVYVITPYNSDGTAGTTSTITPKTLTDITSLSISSFTDSQIVLAFSGNYTTVSISRGGSSIATGVTGTTYTDSSGLTGDASYTYIVTPYDSSSNAGITSTITQKTLPNVTSLSVSSYTASQIVLAYSGNYTNVNIIRGGISIATNITGTTYTDSSGLIGDASYTYLVIPHNSVGIPGTSSTITQKTLPNITSLSVSSYTDVQIVLAFPGYYTTVNITRDGSSIATDISGTTYTDASSGLSANTSYTYVVTPYNSSGIAGSTLTKTQKTLSDITSLSVSSETASQIVLAYSGSYVNVSITRDGSSIATHITGTTYTDSSGLTGNTSYTYIVTPYDSSSNAGITSTITQSTLTNITSLSVSSYTTSQIVLAFSGTYTTVNISRDGSSIATDIADITYTDASGLTGGTSYTYVLTPYDASGNVGTTSTITQSTLATTSTLTSLTISSYTTSQIVLAYSGSYTNVSISRNGTAMATNITGTTYTDSSGLIANTLYTYVVTPKNSLGTSGFALTIIQSTLPVLSSLNVSNYTDVQITLAYTGNYTTVNISRDGSSIATNVTGTTYTDASSGLTANTSYTYIVTPYDASGDAGTTSTITQRTLADLTSLSVSSYTTSQIVLAYTGGYTNVSISRNGSAIATNVTGTSYTDSSGLTANTAYTYIVTPNDVSGNSGSTLTITQRTLPNLTSLSVSSYTATQIILAYTGNYTNVSITRNGSSIATNISGTSYTDSSGLIGDTSYTYIVTPYNASSIAGSTSTVTQRTLPNITSLDISSNETATQLILEYTGNYTDVSITRNGTAIATSISGITYTDASGLTGDTSYIYNVTPNDSSNNTSGTYSTISHITLPLLASLSVFSKTDVQIILEYSGHYTNVSITQNGTSIATNVTGTTYTSTGLTGNTSYTYIVTPYNSGGVVGSTSTITVVTLPNVSENTG